MIFTYKTSGVCSRAILIEIDEHDIVQSVRYEGGCNGNLQGIGHLVEGMPAAEVIRRLESISCNGRPTSCPDQLARALKEYMAQKA